MSTKPYQGNTDLKHRLFLNQQVQELYHLRQLNRVYAENRSFSCSGQSEFFTHNLSATSSGEALTNFSNASTCLTRASSSL
jgi:hypothetical protein